MAANAVKLMAVEAKVCLKAEAQVAFIDSIFFDFMWLSRTLGRLSLCMMVSAQTHSRGVLTWPVSLDVSSDSVRCPT